jgi:cysteine synthase A
MNLLDNARCKKKMKIAKDITQLIGNTPLVMLNTPSKLTGATILGKCEFMNPTSSVKDRIGFHMIKKAQEENLIDEKTTIIEPTSGNTGIALAANCASQKLKLILTMPESMSIERRKLLKALGATIVLTPASKGMDGAIQKANELQKEIKNSIILQQFANPSNPQIHSLTTAKEILKDTDNSLDAFIASVGTGGTLSGSAKTLKEHLLHLVVFAVEPEDSAVLSGESASTHNIQGIGAGFIPEILDTNIYDEVIKVSDEDAIKTAKMLAKEEGLLVGISSGANVWATMQIASRDEFKGKTLVTILCDTAERYMSTELFDE